MTEKNKKKREKRRIQGMWVGYSDRKRKMRKKSRGVEEGRQRGRKEE